MGIGRLQIAALAALMLSTGLQAQSAESLSPAEELIVRARGYLGDESALEKVNSLKIELTFNDYVSESSGRMVMYAEKPDRQRIEIYSGDRVMVNAVNELSGWHSLTVRDSETGEAGEPRVTPMSTESYWAARFAVYENLYFYRGYIRGRGISSYEGKQFWRDQEYDVLKIWYSPDLAYRRYFEDNGRLAVTFVNDETTLIDQGTLEFGGIKFPHQTEIYKGEQRTSRLTVESVEINPEFDPALFRYPISF